MGLSLGPDQLTKRLHHQWEAETDQTITANFQLYTLPITAYSLRLTDEVVRVAVVLRLEAVICEHICPCGTGVTTTGSHGLACPLGLGRMAQHVVINETRETIYRALGKAGFLAVKE